ncbi:MAG: erythronate-4-phosphate dehydrogenase, partial [Paludibacteraceae bacterium]|nr:erythronate-4-phosphate dehydrogenase [Paludibacteraceae bacterium]
MKIVIDDKIPLIRGLAERLADEVVYLPGSKIGPSDVRDADALVVRTRTLCNRQLLNGSRVRFIATATIGYDHLDVDYLREKGIEWTNCPGCNATSVAQYVRNALLEAEREGMIRLGDSVLGIVGFGHVGTAVYEAMRPYVKKTVVNDPFLGRFDAVDSCDVITLHTPLTFEGSYPTHHLIDGKSMRKLKRNPIIINAARGGVVD